MALPLHSKVLEECRIHPLSGPFTGPKTIPLSFFDLPWVTWFYYKPVYFYEFNHSKTYFVQTVLPKIKFSLSVALQHFYPLAGHLTWPQDANKPEIICNDGDSVPLLVTESNLDFDHLSGNNAKDVNEFDTLVPKFSRSMSTDDRLIPLLALQVTLFPDKGICIGFNFHHVAVDGRAVSYFIRTWASICKGPETESGLIADGLLPCLDMTIVKDPKGLELKYVNGGIEEHIIKRENMNVSNMPIRTAPLGDSFLATFVLGSSEIKDSKNWSKLTFKPKIILNWHFIYPHL